MKAPALASLVLSLVANSTIAAPALHRITGDLKIVALPRLDNARLSLARFRFTGRVEIANFVPLLLRECVFDSASSEVHAFGPIEISDCRSLQGTIRANRKLSIRNSTSGESFETIEVTGASKCRIEGCRFTSSSGIAVLQLTNAENARIRNCTFEKSSGNAIISKNSSVEVTTSRFVDLSAEEGAGVLVDSGELRLVDCLFQRCTARQHGGAISIRERQGSVLILRCRFAANTAPSGLSISAGADTIVEASHFHRAREREIAGEKVTARNSKFGMGVKLALDFTIPTAAVPTRTPSLSPTASPASTIPRPTLDTRPTPTAIPMTEDNGQRVTLIVFVSVICGIVVIVVIVIVVVFLVRKKKNQIYPASDGDEVEREPERTTVIVKNIYAVNTVIP